LIIAEEASFIPASNDRPGVGWVREYQRASDLYARDLERVPRSW